ncbi:hypothetical protein [Mycolicibacterium nivoides]|uniref:hypothetical protein n=1 Tax=Mycolicibacterium nivoides TaxID=2487344 RepID=UPI000F5C239C|nr:hypothetical protein [Mycolicibacterium nivoides]
MEWGSVAAYLALAISLGNTAWTIRKETRKPINERQQALRDQLRAVLVEVQTDTRNALAELQRGKTPAYPVPDALTNLRDRVSRVSQDGLTCPSRESLSVLGSEGLLNAYWSSAQYADERLKNHEDYGRPIEDIAARRTQEQFALRRELEHQKNRIDEMIDVLTKIDHGDRKTIRKYKAVGT